MHNSRVNNHQWPGNFYRFKGEVAVSLGADSKLVYNVSFIPELAGNYEVDIKVAYENGQHVIGGHSYANFIVNARRAPAVS